MGSEAVIVVDSFAGGRRALLCIYQVPESPPYIDFSVSLVACGLFDRPREECWIMDPFFSPF
jgi:hypothetical protein